MLQKSRTYLITLLNKFISFAANFRNAKDEQGQQHGTADSAMCRRTVPRKGLFAGKYHRYSKESWM